MPDMSEIDAMNKLSMGTKLDGMTRQEILNRLIDIGAEGHFFFNIKLSMKEKYGCDPPGPLRMPAEPPSNNPFVDDERARLAYQTWQYLNGRTQDSWRAITVGDRNWWDSFAKTFIGRVNHIEKIRARTRDDSTPELHPEYRVVGSREDDPVFDSKFGLNHAKSIIINRGYGRIEQRVVTEWEPYDG